MPMHFGRFRLFNDDKQGNNVAVETASFVQVPGPLGYTLVGPGALFPVLDVGFYAEKEFTDGLFQTPQVNVTVRLVGGLSVGHVIPIPAGSAALLRSLDLEVFLTGGGIHRLKYFAAYGDFRYEEGIQDFA